MTVEPATPDDFEGVLPLFDAFRNPPISAEQWRLLFHYPWPSEERLRGFVLRDGARIVGFFGVILYERTIEGRVEKFANLTSWVTLPEYRNHSLRLFQAVIGIEDRTLTCHTANASSYPLYRRFGFEDLESKWIVLLPVPSLRRPLGWLRGRITTNREILASRLRGVARQTFIHHRSTVCQQMMVTYRGVSCLIVYTKTKGRRAYFSRIHHVSNPEVFHACLDHIRWRIALANHTVFLAIDGRIFCHSLPPNSRETLLSQVAVYRSKTLRPEQVDNLYTELILLGL